MIDATLEFPTSDLRAVVALFCTLPEALRPTQHSLSERGKKTPILDTESYLDSLREACMGPILKGPRVMYIISFFEGFVGDEYAKSDSITCQCMLNVTPALAQQFMAHMAIGRPIFGFACEIEERLHRNRVTVKQGISTGQFGVGDDTQKYIPGFYWITLLPDTLMKKHGVLPAQVAQIAQEHIEFEGGQHLFRFYTKPEDWKTTSAVTDLCTSLPGVFNIEKVKPLLPAAENFLELMDILDEWC